MTRRSWAPRGPNTREELARLQRQLSAPRTQAHAPVFHCLVWVSVHHRLRPVYLCTGDTHLAATGVKGLSPGVLDARGTPPPPSLALPVRPSTVLGTHGVLWPPAHSQNRSRKTWTSGSLRRGGVGCGYDAGRGCCEDPRGLGGVCSSGQKGLKVVPAPGWGCNRAEYGRGLQELSVTIHGRRSPSSPQHRPPGVPIHPAKLNLTWPSFLPPPSPPLAGGGEGGCLCSGPSPLNNSLSHPACSLPVFYASPALTPTSLGLWLSWKDLLSLFQSVCTMHSVTAPELYASSCCSLNHFSGFLDHSLQNMLECSLSSNPNSKTLCLSLIPWLFFGGKGGEPHGLQDLCSPTRDQTCISCSGSMEF